jgi:hypothetical protein
VFLQKPNDLLQHSGFVHFPRVSREHGAKLFDENIELVPTLLLRLVSRSSATHTQHTGYWNIPLYQGLVKKQRYFLAKSVLLRSSYQKLFPGGNFSHVSELSNGARKMFC